ncbi:MAG: hypothetical protein U1E56_04435 [Bauldia sp.]
MIERPVLLALAAALGWASPALACACCADTGERVETRAAFTSGQREQFLAVRYAPAADLYANEAFPQNVRGIATPIETPYRLRVTVASSRLRFDLIDSAGKGGAIVLPLPRQLERFAVDLRDEPKGGLGPALYHEWRVTGPAELSGIFAARAKRATARLILQGRGNRCTDARDLASWSLIVSGPGVAFTLLGELGAEDSTAR